MLAPRYSGREISDRGSELRLVPRFQGRSPTACGKLGRFLGRHGLGEIIPLTVFAAALQNLGHGLQMLDALGNGRQSQAFARLMTERTIFALSSWVPMVSTNDRSILILSNWPAAGFSDTRLS